MNTTVAERVAALEAERAMPTPRRSKPDPNAPYTAAQQTRHREELLAALRGATRRTSS